MSHACRLTYQERPALEQQEQSSEPHLEANRCSLLLLRNQLKNGPHSSTKKKDFSVPQVVVNIKLALS